MVVPQEMCWKSKCKEVAMQAVLTIPIANSHYNNSCAYDNETSCVYHNYVSIHKKPLL